MPVAYKSYLEFVITADVLTRELVLTPKEAAELLAKISGYDDHSTMPIGQASNGPAPSRSELFDRLVALRPDICLERADAIITKLNIHELDDQKGLPAAEGHAPARDGTDALPLSERVHFPTANR
jgi:hypothetical protein